MRSALSFGCFVAGTVAFLRFFYLVPQLRRERRGAPRSRLESWFPWVVGDLTPAGDKLRRHMNSLMVIGWVLLVAGLLLRFS